MKCQNCGKDQINFHYSSNINGCITERYLCSECADSEGDFSEILGAGVFDSMFDSCGEAFGFIAPSFGFINAHRQFAARPQVGIIQKTSACCAENDDCRAESGVCCKDAPDVDVDMQKRRELNIMREELRAAIVNEDFEKAAVLRDNINEFEKEDIQ